MLTLLYQIYTDRIILGLYSCDNWLFHSHPYSLAHSEYYHLQYNNLISRVCPRGVIVKVTNCGIVVSEFVLLSL